jgi:hypothetical protein
VDDDGRPAFRDLVEVDRMSDRRRWSGYADALLDRLTDLLGSPSGTKGRSLKAFR